METIISDFKCSDCKFGCDGLCKVYGYEKPDNCTDFVLNDVKLPTDENEYDF